MYYRDTDFYADKDKARRTCNAQRARYYDRLKGDKNVSGMFWEDWEEQMVMDHDLTGREISEITGRSVRAIQGKRHKLRRALDQKEET